MNNQNVWRILSKASQWDQSIYDVKNKRIRKSTVKMIKQEAERFGAYLIEKYSKKHIVLLAQNSKEFLEAFFGIVGSGNISIPMDIRLTKEECAKLSEYVDADVLIYDKSQEEKVVYLSKHVSHIKEYICLQETQEEGMKNFSECRRDGSLDVEIEEEDVCSMFFTSGTTGNPKAVMLTHKNIVSNVNVVSDSIIYKDMEFRILTLLPVSHVFGLVCEVLLAMNVGAEMFINDGIPQMMKNMQEFKPNFVMMVPMMIQYLIAYLKGAEKKYPGVGKDMLAARITGGELKYIISGGAFLNPDYITYMKEYGIHIKPGYGMTECAPQIATTSICEAKGNSVGKVIDNVQIKIVDQEIWVKGDNVMKGYYKLPKETDQVLQDGWLKTGDLGYLDEENHLYLTGRKKNLIILSNGENVSPEMIENRLMSYPTVISEVVVYGKNDQIMAEVFPQKNGMAEESAEDLINNVVSKVNETLPIYSKICKVIIREKEFEKTSTNKIKR